jgi:hypothetical protein
MSERVGWFSREQNVLAPARSGLSHRRRMMTRARAFSDRNESVGIPKTVRVRFKLHAGEGGQHAWPRRFPLIFAKG